MGIKDCFEPATAAVVAGPVSGSGWIELKAADCSDHYSSGCTDDFSGVPAQTLTDNNGVIELRNIANIVTGGQKGWETEHPSVWWKDTGIDAHDIQSVEVYIEHLGEQGTPNQTSNKPMYGVMLGTVYSVPHATNNLPTPQHFVRINNWLSNNNGNYYSGIVVDGEGTSASGVPYGANKTHNKNYSFIPFHRATAGPGLVTRARDVYTRPIHNSGGTHTSAAGRDISTQSETNRWFENATSQTLKIGIQSGWMAIWKTHKAGWGPNFRIHYRINEGRLY